MLDDFDDIRLRDLALFDRVAELGTITAAARASRDLERLSQEPLSTIRVHAVFLPEQRADARLRVLIEGVLGGLLEGATTARDLTAGRYSGVTSAQS